MPPLRVDIERLAQQLYVNEIGSFGLPETREEARACAEEAMTAAEEFFKVCQAERAADGEGSAEYADYAAVPARR